MFGALIFAALAVLPGAWVVFPLRLDGAGLWTRVWLAMALSPFVVAVEFAIGRLLGVPFESLAVALAVANLPALLFVVRAPRTARTTSVRERSAAVGALVVVAVVTAVALLPRVLATEDRALSGHAWMHADTIDRLVAGDVVPEETMLAGVRQAYPSTGHVFQALVSHAADRPPASHYIWTNVAWLVAIAGLMIALAREAGGGPIAGAGAILALFYAVNVVGYVPMKLVGGASTIFGDPRYTPWLLKYPFFNQMPFAFALLAAIAWQLVRARPHAVLLAVSLVALGTIYPLLIAPALVLCGLRWLVDRGVALAGATVIGAVATWLALTFVLRDRGPGAMRIADAAFATTKLLTGVVVTLPLIVGVIAWWSPARERRARILVAGGAAAVALYGVLDLPYWRNEYKFVFAAAIAWAPLAGVGIERLVRAAGRRGAFVFAGLAIVGAAPLVHKTYGSPHWGAPPDRRFALDTSSFGLRLAGSHPLAAACERVRGETPRDAILVTRDDSLHWPTLTGRALYVPPPSHEPLPPALTAADATTPPFGSGHPGLNLDADYLVRRVRGYDAALIDERRANVRALFGADDAARGTALDAITRAVERPVVVLASPERDGALLAWLARSPRTDVVVIRLP